MDIQRDCCSSRLALTMTWMTVWSATHTVRFETLRLTLVGRLAGGSTICDSNHEQGLLERVLPGGTEQERLQNLLVESRSERGKT